MTKEFIVATALFITIMTHGGVAHAYVSPSTGMPHATGVLRGFEEPEYKWSPGHRGVDLDLPIGGEVLAAGSGTVAFTGMVAGKPVISIDHPDGLRTSYQPVHALVEQGEVVDEGEVIGHLAHPVDNYPGLHWGVITGRDAYMDPLELLDTPVIRLKPL